MYKRNQQDYKKIIEIQKKTEFYWTEQLAIEINLSFDCLLSGCY